MYSQTFGTSRQHLNSTLLSPKLTSALRLLNLYSLVCVVSLDLNDLLSMCFTGVVLYVLRNHTIEERANAILHMRLRIREQFRDVRNNGLVGKALWNYVDSITGPSGLKVLDATSPMLAMASTSTGAKRKRKGSDADDDYHPSPIRSLGSKTKTRSSGRR